MRWPSTLPSMPLPGILDHVLGEGRARSPSCLGARGRAPPRARARRADRPRPPAAAARSASRPSSASHRARSRARRASACRSCRGAGRAGAGRASRSPPPPLTITPAPGRARDAGDRSRSAPPGSAGREWRRRAPPGPHRVAAQRPGEARQDERDGQKEGGVASAMRTNGAAGARPPARAARCRRRRSRRPARVARRSNASPALTVPLDTGSPRGARDRQGLAGQRGLVHHRAVARSRRLRRPARTSPGPHEETVADLDLLHGDLLELPARGAGARSAGRARASAVSSVRARRPAAASSALPPAQHQRDDRAGQVLAQGQRPGHRDAARSRRPRRRRGPACERPTSSAAPARAPSSRRPDRVARQPAGTSSSSSPPRPIASRAPSATRRWLTAGGRRGPSSEPGARLARSRSRAP